MNCSSSCHSRSWMMVSGAFLLLAVVCTACTEPKTVHVPEEPPVANRVQCRFSGTAILAASLDEVVEQRECQKRKVFRSQPYQAMRERYPASISLQTMGGVQVEVFASVAGVPKHNERRVLINLHGGGFISGGRAYSHLESAPIAAIGEIRVLSIDYRMAPEHIFPAASEDVAAVYRELLKDYSSHQIGVYGCSAGALLAARAIAWFKSVQLPRPGALGLFCAGAGFWTEGESGPFALQYGYDFGPVQQYPYFKGIDPNNPLAFPIRSEEILASFPPTLLITGTRDFGLSSVVETYSRLVTSGVQADLVVWEDLPHAFLYNPDLPESRKTYELVARFFERHLQ